jgi:hypothetical protein
LALKKALRRADRFQTLKGALGTADAYGFRGAEPIIVKI